MEKRELDAEVSRLTQELFDLETEKKEYNKEMNSRIKALKNGITSAFISFIYEGTQSKLP